jgi:hypothetical protein
VEVGHWRVGQRKRVKAPERRARTRSRFSGRDLPGSRFLIGPTPESRRSAAAAICSVQPYDTPYECYAYRFVIVRGLRTYCTAGNPEVKNLAGQSWPHQRPLQARSSEEQRGAAVALLPKETASTTHLIQPKLQTYTEYLTHHCDPIPVVRIAANPKALSIETHLRDLSRPGPDHDPPVTLSVSDLLESLRGWGDSESRHVLKPRRPQVGR